MVNLRIGMFFHVITDSLCFWLCHIYISSPASHIYSWLYHTLFGLWPVVNYSLVAWELFTVFFPSFESRSRRFLHEPIPESSSIKLLRPTIDSIFFMLKIPEKFHFLLLKPPRNLSRKHFHAVSTAPEINGGLESLGGGVDGAVSTHRTWESVGISVLYSQH